MKEPYVLYEPTLAQCSMAVMDRPPNAQDQRLLSAPASLEFELTYCRAKDGKFVRQGKYIKTLGWLMMTGKIGPRPYLVLYRNKDDETGRVIEVKNLRAIIGGWKAEICPLAGTKIRVVMTRVK